MKPIHAIAGLMLFAPAAAAWAAEAPCCASGDNGKPGARSTFLSSTQLGQTSPNAQNLSLSPEYQVFQFTRGGIRYLEVADAAGAPRAAFTVVDRALIALPIGHDDVQQVAAAPAWTEVVFEDMQVTVAKRVGADGAVVWQVFVK